MRCVGQDAVSLPLTTIEPARRPTSPMIDLSVVVRPEPLRPLLPAMAERHARREGHDSETVTASVVLLRGAVRVSPFRCPVCGVTQPGDACTRDDCGFTPDPGDPVQTARDWLARIRRQLNEGDTDEP